MFEQTFVDGRGKTNRTWTVLVSFLGQIVADRDCHPDPDDLLRRSAQDPVDQLPGGAAAATAAASAAGRRAVKVVKVIPRQFDAGRLMAPKAVPKEVAMIKEEELPPPSASGGVVGGVPGGVPGGAAGGVIGGIIGSVPSAAPPPPPPPQEAEAGDASAHPRGRQRAAGQADPPAEADLSAAGQTGAHPGRGKV